jgi:hypothetical protein
VFVVAMVVVMKVDCQFFTAMNIVVIAVAVVAV